jgi:hypothetical protein
MSNAGFTPMPVAMAGGMYAIPATTFRYPAEGVE